MACRVIAVRRRWRSSCVESAEKLPKLEVSDAHLKGPREGRTVSIERYRLGRAGSHAESLWSASNSTCSVGLESTQLAEYCEGHLAQVLYGPGI